MRHNPSCHKEQRHWPKCRFHQSFYLSHQMQHPHCEIRPQLYQNNIPQVIIQNFTDVYLFCLHKDNTDHTKLRPLGIPTAIGCIIASHVAKSMKDKSHPTSYHTTTPMAFPMALLSSSKLCNSPSNATLTHPNTLIASPPVQLFFSTSLTNSTVYPDKNSLPSFQQTSQNFSHSPPSSMPTL